MGRHQKKIRGNLGVNMVYSKKNVRYEKYFSNNPQISNEDNDG